MQQRTSKSLNADELEAFQRQYQAGQTAFERGRYRESVQHLETASALGASDFRLNGEVQTWLIAAYEAAGQRSDAIALCHKLSHHPDLETRKQCRRLLYILEAPQLKLHPEWLVEIPDLAKLEKQDSNLSQFSNNRAPVKSATKKSSTFQLEPTHPHAPDTSNNGFLWVALAIAILVLGSIVWLG